MSDVSASVTAEQNDTYIGTDKEVDGGFSITVNAEPVTDYTYEQPATYTK